MSDDDRVSNHFTFDGRPIALVAGEPIASALIRAGIVAVRRTRTGRPRGPFCMIGVCQDCLVEVDGVPGVQACLARATSGQEVHSQDWSRRQDESERT